MFELFVGTDAVRRHVEGPLKPGAQRQRRRGDEKRRRPTAAVRLRSAAALRSLAARLEPTPTR
jgi:hypothetical protein